MLNKYQTLFAKSGYTYLQLMYIHRMYINLYCSSLGIPLHLDIFPPFVATHEGHPHSWGQLTPSDGPSIQMTLETKAARNKSTS